VPLADATGGLDFRQVRHGLGARLVKHFTVRAASQIVDIVQACGGRTLLPSPYSLMCAPSAKPASIGRRRCLEHADE
jgi:hypothetical protein